MTVQATNERRDCDYCGSPWHLGQTGAAHFFGVRKCCPDCRHAEVLMTETPIKYRATGITGHYHVIVDGQEVGEVYKYQTYPAAYPSWVSWKFRGAGDQGWGTRDKAARALLESLRGNDE